MTRRSRETTARRTEGGVAGTCGAGIEAGGHANRPRPPREQLPDVGLFRARRENRDAPVQVRKPDLRSARADRAAVLAPGNDELHPAGLPLDFPHGLADLHVHGLHRLFELLLKLLDVEDRVRAVALNHDPAGRPRRPGGSFRLRSLGRLRRFRRKGRCLSRQREIRFDAAVHRGRREIEPRVLREHERNGAGDRLELEIGSRRSGIRGDVDLPVHGLRANPAPRAAHDDVAVDALRVELAVHVLDPDVPADGAEYGDDARRHHDLESDADPAVGAPRGTPAAPHGTLREERSRCRSPSISGHSVSSESSSPSRD